MVNNGAVERVIREASYDAIAQGLFALNLPFFVIVSSFFVFIRVLYLFLKLQYIFNFLKNIISTQNSKIIIDGTVYLLIC